MRIVSFLATVCLLAAKAPPPGPNGYVLQEISSGLYWISDGAYNTMFLVSSEGVIAVDPLPTLGQKYLDAIHSVSGKPIAYVVYSHSHTDHIGAAYLFPRSAKIVAQRLVAEKLRRENDPRRPLPDIIFEQRLELKFGDQTLQLEYRGANHEEGNALIYAPKQKVLEFVDVIYPGYMAYKNLGIAGDVDGYIASHEWALSYPFDVFVGGHVNRLGNRQDVRTSLEFVKDLRQTANAQMSDHTYGDFIKAHPTNDLWNLHNEYEKLLVNACYSSLLPRWAGRLKDSETYLRDNCWSMTEALIVDLAPVAKVDLVGSRVQ